MKQYKDYELIFPEDSLDEGDQQGDWHIRILTGDFVETVVKFNTLSLDTDDDVLKFSFDVVGGPQELDAENNIELQETVGGILTDILEEAVANASATIDLAE